MLNSERAHMAMVAELPCIVCGDFPAQVHHALTGGGRRRNHMKVLPLCYRCHQGDKGIHTLGRKAWVRLVGYTEQELLDKVDELLK